MDPTYLDHAATTPLRPEVVAAMDPYASEVFGNPSSLHGTGRKARAALEDARSQVADALGARAAEIRFVRGGTESDNLAILGSCRAARRATGRPTPLFVSSVEHSAVLEAAEHADRAGDARLELLGVAADGRLDLSPLESVSASHSGGDSQPTPVVSVMWANNETGMVLPVDEVVATAAESGATVHSDACQAIGKVRVDLRQTPMDLLTATGHKINGPRGTGILFVREGTPVEPLVFGGGQERGLRPGTEDVAGAVGLATALRLAVSELDEVSDRMRLLRDRLEAGLRSRIEGIRVNGSGAPRAPHVSSIGIPGVSDGQTLLMALDLEGLAVSGGSACHSGAGEGSHVIAALYGDHDALATVRFSFGRGSTEAEVDHAIAVTSRVVDRLRGATEDTS